MIDLRLPMSPLGTASLKKSGITAQTAASCDWNCNHIILLPLCTELLLFHLKKPFQYWFLICVFFSSSFVCFILFSTKHNSSHTCDPLWWVEEGEREAKEAESETCCSTFFYFLYEHITTVRAYTKYTSILSIYLYIWSHHILYTVHG